MVLLAPASLHPATWLLGDPRIDVWNHAWGFWYVAESLAAGQLPLHTALAGAPAGGALYFIDTPSAVMWAPVTLLFGPAVAYNLSLVVKVALAGLAGQLLAGALGAERRAAWLAGLGLCTLPFLLCELNNGITEVCGVHWSAFSLWALVRLRAEGRWRHAGLLGLFLGLAGVASFYYGLAMGLIVGVGLGLGLLGGVRDGAGSRRRLQQAAAAGALALVLVAPVWLAFQASLAAPDALIERPGEMNLGMLAHNAVDPRTWVMPGDFQSVDLAGLHGEPFRHTAYLRWSVLLLAGLAVLRRRALRPWAALAGLSLVLGLGARLWWAGAWVELGGYGVSLPFGWLVALLPDVAITHPLRLSIGGQILVTALAAVGLGELLPRVGRAWAPVALGAGLLVAAEGLLVSAAQWPLEVSPAAVPASVAALSEAEGMVLDLPAEVGATMRSSRYFWYQTVHGRPIPYAPDVRARGMRDEQSREAVMGAYLGRGAEVPRRPEGEGLAWLRAHYAAVVTHPELEAEAGLRPTYSVVLRRALGAPYSEGEGVRVWLLPADEPGG